MANDHSRVDSWIDGPRCDECRRFGPTYKVLWSYGKYHTYLCSGFCGLKRLAEDEEERVVSTWRVHKERQLLPTTWGWMERSHKYPYLHKYERIKHANSRSRRHSR